MSRRIVLGGFLLVYLLVGSAAWASLPYPIKNELWPDWHWGSQQNFIVPGARLTQHPFTAQQAPSQAARHLVEQAAAVFDRLMVIDGGIVLSGLHEGKHWFGWLRAVRQGTQGVVSVLASDQTSGPRFDAGTYFPPGTRQLIRVSESRDGAWVTISGHIYEGDSANLQLRIGQALVSAGWTPSEASWPGAHGWRRAHAFLQSRVHPHDGHSIVWVWYREGGGS